ncbi:hemolysin-type calcium-binding protein [Novosphingobium sp. Rr 2-17]|uniref:calcium-binding protein n=1 Tax=Novosphingobium sp. Rr 2-17 TaxID=555793 RepID=UPI000269821F|nr:hypothetical protein [Novosphingobium sp. Rr 2-17]EIZ78377.1 hemolysin-type calcium-binding protein [Novosphingobium sp. Rr 2-17]
MPDSIYGLGASTYVGGTTGGDVIVALTALSQLAGGSGSDNMHGSSESDVLTGGKGNDFMFGGGGSDTFLWSPSDLSSDGTTYDKVFDFDGGGVASGDNLVFYGFGADSTFTVTGMQSIGDGTVIYKYTLTDSTTSYSQTIYISSKTGLALTTDDYHFYGTV